MDRRLEDRIPLRRASRLYGGKSQRLPNCQSMVSRPGVTVILMGNAASTDALNVAEHTAAFVLSGGQARLAATGPPTALTFWVNTSG